MAHKYKWQLKGRCSMKNDPPESTLCTCGHHALIHATHGGVIMGACLFKGCKCQALEAA